MAGRNGMVSEHNRQVRHIDGACAAVEPGTERRRRAMDVVWSPGQPMPFHPVCQTSDGSGLGAYRHVIAHPLVIVRHAVRQRLLREGYSSR